jgi:hypothetical protein
MKYDDPDPSTGLYEGQYDGTWLPNPVKAYQSPEVYMQEFLSGYFGTSGMEVLDVKYPEGEAASEIAAMQQQMQAQTDVTQAQTNASTPNAQGSAQIRIDSATITSRFSLSGTTYKMESNCLILHNIMTIQTQDLYNTYTTTTDIWTVVNLSYYVAEESLFEKYYEDSVYFQNNLILNQQWLDAINQTATAIFQQNADIAIKDFQMIQAQLQQQAQQIAASSSQNYAYASSGGSSSSGYSSSVMNGATNAITGNSYYEAPDGGSVLLDYNDYHYTDGTSIYSSPSPLNIGGTSLSELNDLGTMGGD